ncbi:MAG: terpene cyclase/mutase family protein, partial [Clostridia bacterium]|nr:terpene cyclase/mutase family protein [Clostridia bacterium]
MKNNVRRLAGFLLALCAFWSPAGGVAAVQQSTALIDALCAADGAAGPQEWMDGVLAAHPVNGREWFIFSLRAAEKPYDFSAYAAALQPAIAADGAAGAVTRQKYALLRLACGERDVPVPPDSVSDRTVMSLIYGLHLLHNGCPYRQTAAEVARSLLALQKQDGGWAVMGNYGDVDVTAMAIQALAPLYRESAVREAVDRALALLAAKQLDDGTFKSFGAANAESTAQVILALAALGRDPLTEPDFCKKKDLLSALLSFQLPGGLFAHVQGGEVSVSACAQALMAFTALERLQAGRNGNLYLFEKEPAGPGTSTSADAGMTAPSGPGTGTAAVPAENGA